MRRAASVGAMPCGAAFEECLSQFGFELRNLHAERGLHDIEALGRACDGAILEEGR